MDQKRQQYRQVLPAETVVTIANPHGEEFPAETLAKHIRVGVTGHETLNVNGPGPVVNMRSIEKLSDGCKGPAALRF